MMFEAAKYFHGHPALIGSLSRLNRALFLMLIDSAFLAIVHSPSKLNLTPLQTSSGRINNVGNTATQAPDRYA
jgi:hypothetical protein